MSNEQQLLKKGMGCPVDGRVRPVFITYKNKRRCAVSDGKGDCYMHEDTHQYYPERTPLSDIFKVLKEKYVFERGLTGFDY